MSRNAWGCQIAGEDVMIGNIIGVAELNEPAVRTPDDLEGTLAQAGVARPGEDPGELLSTQAQDGEEVGAAADATASDLAVHWNFP